MDIIHAEPITERPIPCDRCGRVVPESAITEVDISYALSEWLCPTCVPDEEGSEASIGWRE
jgi:hypothetical protein